MSRWFRNLSQSFESLLNQPFKVMLLCLAFAFVNLVVDGTLLQLWGLKRNIDRIQVESDRAQQKLIEVRKSVAQASDPRFLEMQARERFDLVEQDDLVFVFSDEGSDADIEN